jgi:hypothetical protein
MLAVRLGSSHEKRLIHEGQVLSRQLRRRVRALGGDARGPDDEVVKSNHMLGHDVVGLVTLRVRVGAVVATLICAPGVYFRQDHPERRAALDELAAVRRAQGRRALVVTKHEALGREPFDLVAGVARPTSDRRRCAEAVLASTGRRPCGADRRWAAGGAGPHPRDPQLPGPAAVRPPSGETCVDDAA